MLQIKYRVKVLEKKTREKDMSINTISRRFNAGRRNLENRFFIPK